MKPIRSFIPRYLYRSLRGQPKRAGLTWLSILLAVGLMATVSSLTASIQQTQVNQAVAYTGEFHGTFKHLTPAHLESIRQNPDVSRVGSSLPLGSLRVGSVTVSIEGFDANAIDQFNLQLALGQFPQANGEIALEGWVLDLMDPRPEIGDRLNLSYLRDEFDPKGDLTRSLPAEDEFILTGVLENIPQAQLVGVSLGLVAQETVVNRLDPEQIRAIAFIEARGSAGEIRTTLAQLQQRMGLDPKWASLNESLLAALGTGDEARLPVLLLAALLVTAAAATIYNIFQISVIERVRQFGMLRAIGATPGQVILLVLGEAFVLSLAAVPAGLLVGTGAAALLAQSVHMLQRNISALVVPAWALTASALTGFSATLVSALLPAVFAGRVSPMLAIRQAGTQQSGRGSKAGACMRRVFGLTGQMAYQNLWRSRSRSLITVFSLGLGLLLFVVISAYAQGMDAGSVAENFLRGDYAVLTNSMDRSCGYTQEVADAIAAVPGVEGMLASRIDDFNLSLLPAGQVEPELRERLLAQSQRSGTQDSFSQTGYVQGFSQVFGYDLDVLASLADKVIEGEIDLEALASGQAALVVDPEGVYGLHAGDELRVKNTAWENGQGTGNEQTFTIAAVLSEPPVHIGYSTLGPKILLQEAVFQAFTGSSLYRRFDLSVDPSADSALIEEQLGRLAKTTRDGSLLSFKDVRAGVEKEKRDLLMMVYGLVGIVCLIGMVNIVNTLTTNLIVRTREFGILRAVGMTGDQLKAMTRLEGSFYGLLSSAWGGTAAVLILAALQPAMEAQRSPIQLSIPWLGLLLAVLGSLAVSTLATLSPTRRIAGLAITDTLRSLE